MYEVSVNLSLKCQVIYQVVTPQIPRVIFFLLLDKSIVIECLDRKHDTVAHAQVLLLHAQRHVVPMPKAPSPTRPGLIVAGKALCRAHFLVVRAQYRHANPVVCMALSRHGKSHVLEFSVVT